MIPRFLIFPWAVEGKSLCKRGFLFVPLTFAVGIATEGCFGFAVKFSLSLLFCFCVTMTFGTALESSLVLWFSEFLLLVSLYHIYKV